MAIRADDFDEDLENSDGHVQVYLLFILLPTSCCILSPHLGLPVLSG